MKVQSGATVVLRYRDGHAARCLLAREFSPRSAVVEVVDTEGHELQVDVDELKAVFFLKDPRQRDAQLELGTTPNEPRGSSVARAEFFDGEVMGGRVETYSVQDKGFYLFPTSVDSNNERVFVVASALNTLSIEGFSQA